MKAAVYYETGGPEVFRYEDVPDPTCGPGEVLISVEAVSIEGGDTLNRLGGDLVSVPHIVGYQCAGKVLEVGDGVDDLVAGDRVVTVGLDGSHAELRVAGRCVLLAHPRRGADRGGGHACRFRSAPRTTACSSSVGSRPGRPPSSTPGPAASGSPPSNWPNGPEPPCWPRASSAERLERLGALGLDHGINYTATDFVEAVRALTDGRGADVIVDSVGGSNLQPACTAWPTGGGA